MELIEICHRHCRCWVPVGGFANGFRLNPSDYPGIELVGWPFRRSLANRREAVERLIRRLDGGEIEGKLWVFRGGRIVERHSAGDEKDKIL